MLDIFRQIQQIKEALLCVSRHIVQPFYRIFMNLACPVHVVDIFIFCNYNQYNFLRIENVTYNTKFLSFHHQLFYNKQNQANPEIFTEESTLQKFGNCLFIF